MVGTLHRGRRKGEIVRTLLRHPSDVNRERLMARIARARALYSIYQSEAPRADAWERLLTTEQAGWLAVAESLEPKA